MRVSGIKRDQRAVVAGGRVLADRNKDASAENLDEEAVAVPRITDLFVLCEVDQVNAHSGCRQQLLRPFPVMLVLCVEVPRLHGWSARRVLLVAVSEDPARGVVGAPDAGPKALELGRFHCGPGRQTSTRTRPSSIWTG